jgi:hypothetical protein
MKSKIVLWGKNSSEEKCLIALELTPDDSMVHAWIFSEELATEELGNKLLFDWKEGKEIDLPEGFIKNESELSITEPLLPEGYTVDKPEILQRAQTEWQFMVLSSKLNVSYQSELEEIEERILKLEEYNHKEWEGLKNFWDKVREQMRERNLFKEHATALKERTNTLFSKMKELRTSLDAEFKEQAQVNHARFSERLNDIEERVAKNINLYNVFEELKEIQREFRNAKFTRDLRDEIWKRLDTTFKLVKEKRFGPESNTTDKVTRRYNGLLDAIKKMEMSIKRDRNDLDFQNKKINSAYTGQLETQIRQAKLKMIEERVNSKQKKLDEMYKTKIELEDKMEKAKARLEVEAARKAKADAEKAARAAAKAEKVAAAEAAKAEEVAEAPATEEAPKAEAPAEEVAEAPAEEVAEAPAEEVAEAPAEEVAEVPAEEVAEVPATEEAPKVEAPAEEVAEAPATEEAPKAEEAAEATEEETKE